MAQVRLESESGTLIHFRHDYVSGIKYCFYGLVFALALPQMLPQEQEVWILQAVGGLFVFYGLYNFFSRLDIKVHPNQRLYYMTSGIWPFARPKKMSMNDFHGIILSHQLKRSKNKQSLRLFTLWEVGMVFSDRKKEVVCFRSRDEIRAREMFEKFSKILLVPAVDCTQDKNFERNWDELQEDIADWEPITQVIPDVDFQDPPEGTRVEFGRLGFRIQLFRKGFTLSFFLLNIFGLALMALGGFAFIAISGAIDASGGGSPVAGAMVGGVFVLLGAIIIISSIISHFGYARIMLYRGDLIVDFLFLGLPFNEKSLPALEVEEVTVRQDLSRSKGSSNLSIGQESMLIKYELFLRTETKKIIFGRNTKKEILEWIRAALIDTLTKLDEADAA